MIDRLGILRPLRERDFALFWIGWTVLFYFLPGMRDTETPGHTSRVILSEPAVESVRADALEAGVAAARPPTG